MDSMYAAFLGLVASVVLSTILAFVMLPPIRSVLKRACPTGDGMVFWTRFTILMLFLGPLIVTLVFGVPSAEVSSRLSPSDVIIKIATAALVGSFIALGAIGLRMATLRQSPAPPAATTRKSDDQFIK